MGSRRQAMNESNALSVQNLSFSYARKNVLKQVTFNIHQGQCCILLGPNGAGKSTLFSLVTHLYDTRSGKIQLCGHDIRKQPRKALAKLGVVFQQSTLDMDLTVFQNLRYHSALHGISRKLSNQRIQQELERMEMYDRRFEKVRQLNGGHRRRVEIARALLHNPTLLLLDEPTVGLDVHSRKAIVEHVHQLVKQQGIAVLWATHLIDEIDTEHDQLVILDQGSLKMQGTVASILKQTQTDSIDDAFHQLTIKGAA